MENFNKERQTTDLQRQEMNDEAYAYRFTQGEMLDILDELTKITVNKLHVQRLLFQGKK